MPLGYITAEESLPRPDWKPFVVGHLLVEAAETFLGASDFNRRPPLEHRRYLYVRGVGEDGAPLELAFDWYEPGDEGYEEARWLVRFVMAMRGKAV